MKRKSLWMRAVSLFVVMLLALPFEAMAQQGGGTPDKQLLSKEELAQLLAPIALYPDELVAQILMASTYPLEVVEADRWAKSHKQSAGDVLTKQLEKETWDPSVKSLVNFPTVLSAMSEKLDVTAKIGDAFLAQQKDVMDTIQGLRKRAYDAGNLKTTKEQKVVVEKETIIIQPASPQVVYVPTYSPTVVYGVWAYPAYPPYYYYPPPPPYSPAFTFAAGVAVGAAWGYAWGNCNWHGGSVNYNVNQNININNNINRSNYQNQVNHYNKGQGGQGQWQHNPEHRKGVAYKDGATAKQYGQSPARSAQGRQDAARGYGDGRAGGKGSQPSAGTMDRGGKAGADRGAGQRASTGGAAASNRGGPSASNRGGASAGSGRDSAFSGGGSGSQARAASSRGASSQQSFGGGSRGGSSFGGGGGSKGGGFSGGGGGRSGGGGRGGRR